MIASQLRFLYYMLRGESAKAAPHREQVELHAAHVGSVWQVETWEAAALLVIHTKSLGDVVGSTRLAHRLELLSRSVPSLKRYSRIAKQDLMLARREASYTSIVAAEYATHLPRSYVGWAATMGFLACGYNEMGKHSEAKTVCESILEHVTDADREYVGLFLSPDIELAIADAHLGHTRDGLARIDGLLTRFAHCDHPLLQGLLHEARARIFWNAGHVGEYRQSLAEMEHWFRPTGTPALIAKCERLAQLDTTGAVDNERAIPAPDRRANDAVATETATILEDFGKTETCIAPVNSTMRVISAKES